MLYTRKSFVVPTLVLLGVSLLTSFAADGAVAGKLCHNIFPSAGVHRVRSEFQPRA